MSDEDDDLFEILRSCNSPARDGTPTIDGALNPPPAPISSAFLYGDAPLTQEGAASLQAPVSGDAVAPRAVQGGVPGGAPPSQRPVALAPATSHSGCFSIITAPSISSEEADRCGTSAAQGKSSLHPSQVHMEPNSGIRVRGATLRFEQLPVCFAQWPYITFSAALRALTTSAKGSGMTLPNTCVGAIVRKTDPKPGRRPFSVVTLWNMRGVSPSASEEMALLLCGDAFDGLYARLAIGCALAVSNLQPVQESSKSTGATGGRGGSSLLKVSDRDCVRVLGFAADMGTCQSVSKRSGEHCNALVNTSVSRHCTYHVGDLRQAARGRQAVSSSGPSASLVHGSPSARAGGLVSHMTPGVAQASRSLSRRVIPRETFLTVRGVSGLPTSEPSSNLGEQHGMYRGVCGEDPLQVTAICQDPNRVFPSVQSLGVSTRGRVVLQAAVTQELQQAKKRLLRTALHPAQPTRVSERLDRKGGAPPSVSDGVGSHKRPREDDRGPSRKRAMAVVSGDGPPSRRKLGASVGNLVTSVPNDALQPAAADQSNALSADRGVLDELKQRFAPLRSHRMAAFTPMTSHHTGNTVVQPQRPYGASQNGLASASTRASTLVRAVAEALDAEAKTSTGSVSSGKSKPQGMPVQTVKKGPASLVAVADQLGSVNDQLRLEAESERITAYLDKQMAQEKALEVLEGVTEQSISAIYCHGCQQWFAKLPSECVQQRHRAEKRPSVKRFIRCEHCDYRTFVLGHDTVPWKVLPVCPKCQERPVWAKGSAAPAVTVATVPS